MDCWRAGFVTIGDRWCSDWWCVWILKFIGTFGAVGGLSQGVTETRESSVPSARQRLREVHDRQAAALAGFGALDAKVLRLRRATAAVELERLAALGELADVAGVELAAELTGCATSTAREALAAQRRRSARNAAAEWADGAGRER